MPDTQFNRLGRYPVTAYEDSVEIDISRDNGGWSGCGHANELTITEAELEAMLAAIREARAAAMPTTEPGA